MKIFLSVVAILAWLFGAMLLISPAKFYEPTGLQLTPLLATLAQAHGATLVGLGVINWLSRAVAGAAAVPVLAGNLTVQILSLGVVLWTAALGPGAAVSPGVVIHVVLGSLFAYFLVKARRT